MDRKGQADQYQRNAEEFLRQTRDAYVINPSTGLYEMKPEDSEEKIEQNTPGHVHERPFFVSTVPHWTDCVSLLISVLTLVLLVGTVLYAKRTADAAICANRTAQMALKQAEDQFRSEQRPWIALEKVKAPDVHVDQNAGTADVLYRVNNVGHYAASFSVYGQILERPAKPNAGDKNWGREKIIQSQCEKGSADFESRQRLTALPGVPTEYNLGFDGKPSDDFSPHTEKITMNSAFSDPTNPKHLYFQNVGCVIYRSTDGGDLHKLPFVIAIDTHGHRIEPSGPYIIGKAD